MIRIETTSSIETAKEKALDEISKSKQEILKLTEQHNECLRQVKEELAVDIIDKSNAPLQRAITLFAAILTMLVVTIGFSQFIVGKDLKEIAKQKIERQISEMFTYEKAGSMSTGRESLESLRLNALIDSHIIALRRAKIDPHNRRIERLSESELVQLINVLKEPETDSTLFYNALEVAAAHRNNGFIRDKNDQFSKLLAGIFSEKEVTQERRLAILKHFEFDHRLVDVASFYLEKASDDESYVKASFNVMKNFYSNPQVKTQLDSFISSVLVKGKDQAFLPMIAEFLIEENPNSIRSKAIYDLALSGENTARLKVAILGELAKKLPSKNMNFGFNYSETEINMLRNNIVDIWFSMINSGISLSISEYLHHRPYLVYRFSSMQSNNSFIEPAMRFDNLVKDTETMNRLFKKFIKETGSIELVVKFFTLHYNNSPVTLAGLKSLEKDSHISEVWFKKTDNSIEAWEYDSNLNLSKEKLDKFKPTDDFSVMIRLNEDYVAFQLPTRPFFIF